MNSKRRTQPDDFSNYAEYIADTNPNDANSNLRFTKIQKVTGGMEILWQGGANATQYLRQQFNLGSTIVWKDIFSNLPPTRNPSGYTNQTGTSRASFYRLKVTR